MKIKQISNKPFKWLKDAKIFGYCARKEKQALPTKFMPFHTKHLLLSKLCPFSQKHVQDKRIYYSKEEKLTIQ